MRRHRPPCGSCRRTQRARMRLGRTDPEAVQPGQSGRKKRLSPARARRRACWNAWGIGIHCRLCSRPARAGSAPSRPAAHLGRIGVLVNPLLSLLPWAGSESRPTITGSESPAGQVPVLSVEPGDSDCSEGHRVSHRGSGQTGSGYRYRAVTSRWSGVGSLRLGCGPGRQHARRHPGSRNRDRLSRTVTVRVGLGAPAAAVAGSNS